MKAIVVRGVEEVKIKGVLVEVDVLVLVCGVDVWVEGMNVVVGINVLGGVLKHIDSKHRKLLLYLV